MSSKAPPIEEDSSSANGGAFDSLIATIAIGGPAAAAASGPLSSIAGGLVGMHDKTVLTESLVPIQQQMAKNHEAQMEQLCRIEVEISK